MANLKTEMAKNILPRERLEKYGIEGMSNLELLMIILCSGSKVKNVNQLSKEILLFLEDYPNIFDLTYLELSTIKGIGKVKAMQIVSSFELARRLINMKNKKIRFNSPFEIYEKYKLDFLRYEEEHLHVLYFDVKLNLKIKKEISIGGINQTLISINVILKWALKINAVAILLIHNHPTGDPTPSNQDIKETIKLKEAADMIGIKLLDHIIFGNNIYYSFLENDVLN